MAATLYTTRQGETVDVACWTHYGRTANVTEAVLAANPGLAAIGVVLPFATVIAMPEMPASTRQPQLVSLWD